MGNRRAKTRSKGSHSRSRTRSKSAPPPRGLRPVWATLALLVSGLAYAALDQDTGIAPWHRLRVEVEQAEARVRAAKTRNARIAAEIRDLMADPGAVETAIREVIGWVRPGELRIDIEGADPLPPGAQRP